MNILILGSGGRESAFASKMAQSSILSQLYIAPGNAGTSAYGKNINLKLTDFEGIAEFVLKNNVKMVVVGPEEPLVKGIHDFFLDRQDLKHIPVIGPQMQGAQLEGSKDFSKQFMIRHGIPTAAFRSFNKENLEEGLSYLETQKLPIVLKADGLAAGKGVLICESHDDAKTELKAMISDAKFGEASSTVVIEEFLTGIELSVFVLTDGISYKILPEAKDYKRIGEGDTGLNTGGMGSVSPVSFADAEFMRKVEDRVIIPTVEGLKKDAIPYKGFIFIGLMATDTPQGREPYVIEYNVRMGDPETESVIPRIESDLIDLFLGVANENLSDKELKISPKTAATVMIVAGGYPGEYAKGKPITGIENLRHSIAFHAGTELDNGVIKSNGGRVIAITSLQDNLFDAVQNATADAGRIYFDGRYFRPDIGVDLMDIS
jgi:phosphoribosylamine---glycine ligase|uniref:phosphoribosylamine--glycine ligase n=1 Tax=Daejeonella sp. TaxID=2805397 RepID=UPI004049DC2F